MEAKSRPVGRVPGDWRKSVYYHYYMDGVYNLPRIEGVRTDKHKRINYYFPEQEWELFDLEKDPQEIDSPGIDATRVTLNEAELRGIGVPKPELGNEEEGRAWNPPSYAVIVQL